MSDILSLKEGKQANIPTPSIYKCDIRDTKQRHDRRGTCLSGSKRDSRHLTQLQKDNKQGHAWVPVEDYTGRGSLELYDFQYVSQCLHTKRACNNLPLTLRIYN